MARRLLKFAEDQGQRLFPHANDLLVGRVHRHLGCGRGHAGIAFPISRQLVEPCLDDNSGFERLHFFGHEVFPKGVVSAPGPTNPPEVLFAVQYTGL